MSEVRVAMIVVASTPVVCEPLVAPAILVAWPGLPPIVQTP